MSTKSEQYEHLLDSLYEGLYFVDEQRRITFWNRAAEQLTGFGRDEVIGVSCADHVLVHVDENGRPLCNDGCPVMAAILDGEPREANVFFQHKEGHRVPVRARITAVRGEGGEVQGAVQLFSDNTAFLELVQQLREAEERASLDVLTGLPNRGYLDRALTNHAEALERYGWGFGLLMLDIDHFEAVNDTHGHDVGDEAIKLVARTLEHNLRGNDILGRWGGEEFLVLLPSATPASMRKAGERLRAMVEQSSLVHQDQRLRFTVSVGCAMARPGEDAPSVVRRADQAMYLAKDAGRNRVEVHRPLELHEGDHP